MLTKLFDLLVIRRKLKLNKGATMVVTSDAGVETTINIAELAGLDNLSTTELGYLDGALSTNLVASKTAILGTGGALTLGGALTAVTSIGIGSAVLAEAEMELLDGITAGTLAASKVWTSDSSLDTVMPTGGKLTVQSGGDITLESGSTLDVAGTFEIANTAMTASAVELNYNDITTLGTGAASKAVVLDAGEDYTWPDTGVLTIGVLATASEAAEHGAGAIGTAAVPTTKRWIERGGIIVTQITVDLTGLRSVATGDDVIGLQAGGAAYIGRNVEATNGVIFKVEFSCLETPTGGDNDVNVVASSNAALAYDGAGGTSYLSNSGDLLKGQTIQNLVPALTANDYYYLTGGTGDTLGDYTAGMYVLTTYGHAVLA